MIFILLIPNLIFSLIEARRYRNYLLSQYRTQLIERGLFNSILTDSVVVDINYKDNLYNSIMYSKYNISLLGAWIIRYRKIYIWLLYFMLCCWLIKLYILMLLEKNKLIILIILLIVLIFSILIYLYKFTDEIDI